MTKTEILIFKELENKYGKNVLKEVFKMADDDIKANRILFNKRSSSRYYMMIFFRNLEVYIKYALGEAIHV